jgi:hypothetical protein
MVTFLSPIFKLLEARGKNSIDPSSLPKRLISINPFAVAGAFSRAQTIKSGHEAKSFLGA